MAASKAGSDWVEVTVERVPDSCDGPRGLDSCDPLRGLRGVTSVNLITGFPSTEGNSKVLAGNNITPGGNSGKSSSLGTGLKYTILFSRSTVVSCWLTISLNALALVATPPAYASCPKLGSPAIRKLNDDADSVKKSIRILQKSSGNSHFHFLNE